MSYVYGDGFFNYIDEGAARSARLVIAQALSWLKPTSVLDLGCGRGAWLAEWRRSGVGQVVGVDGDYVDRDRLYVDASEFHPADLSAPLDLSARFDLVQSLEVAEHLPAASAAGFVASLCRHGDLVLFSAAVIGQGGENHVNEQPLEYWRALFAAQGYLPYDCVRPAVAEHTEIEPWYRYNTLLYANADGQQRLPPNVTTALVAADQPLAVFAPLGWRLRLALVGAMPRGMVDGIARVLARVNVQRQTWRAARGLGDQST